MMEKGMKEGNSEKFICAKVVQKANFTKRILRTGNASTCLDGTALSPVKRGLELPAARYV